jgi:hypothetical protein
VWGEIVNASSPAAAVIGTTIGAGSAVYGASARGRGATFRSKVAQVRLVPANAASHPLTGKRGDVFLDHAGRLWFCTATGKPAGWKQLA